MTAAEPTAVVLAAGEGKRLAPLTNRRPKPMVPVVNRPLLEHVVEAVADAGIEEIVLVVGYERDRIQTYFEDGDEWDVSIRYAIQETQLGTGHAVLQAQAQVEGPVLVLNGDRIIDPGAVEAVRAALLEDDEPAMAVMRSDVPNRYGVVTLDGEYVDRVIEKPGDGGPSEIINAGVYGVTDSGFECIRETPTNDDGELSLPVAMERMEEVQAVRYDGTWLDVSHLWDLLTVTSQLLDADGGHVAGSVDEGAVLHDSVHVAETASIGPNAVVGRGTAVAENARVGPNATVERSVVFPDATIEAGAVVRDCIVGENATVGGNTTVAGGEATIIVDGVVHEGVTLGGVVGDNATVRGGAALEPGAVLHDGVVVGEGAVAAGRIGRDTTVRRG
jgi:glucose-1-phosphate thymidylyltransferase